jgi:hypothetical protein
MIKTGGTSSDLKLVYTEREKIGFVLRLSSAAAVRSGYHHRPSRYKSQRRDDTSEGRREQTPTKDRICASRAIGFF